MRLADEAGRQTVLVLASDKLDATRADRSERAGRVYVLDRGEEERERARDDAPSFGRALDRVSVRVGNESAPDCRRLVGASDPRLARVRHAVSKDETVFTVEDALFG